MKRVFMTAYGGGHANILKYVYKELSKYQNLQIQFLALTTAPNILQQEKIPFITVKDIVSKLPYQEEVMRLGLQYGVPFHNPSSGIDIDDTTAYYGIGMYDLIQKYGVDQADALFSIHGRKAFLPIESMTLVLEKIAPDACVITASPRMEKATGIASTNLDIPVIRINDLPICERVEHKCKLCVMNEWAKQYALDHSGVEQDNIFVTGQPVFEGDKSIDYHELEKIKKLLGANRFQNIVVFFTENGRKQTAELKAIDNIAAVMKDNLFVIKLHPNQNLDDVLKTKQRNVVFSKDDAKLFFHLADLAITTFSTTGMEAAMLGIPLISVNFEKREFVLNYEDMGIATTAYNEEQLRELITLLLDKNSDLSNIQAKAREAFSYVDHASKNIAELIYTSLRR